MRTLPAAEGFPYGTAKAACYRCHGGAGGDGTNEVLIDFETQIDMEGFLMICQGCGEAVAELLGCCSPSQTARYQGRIRNLEDELVAARGEVDEIKSRLLQAVNA